MKPFLLLQLRPLDTASDNEFESVLKYAHLDAENVVRHRMDKESPKNINLDDYSAVIVAGGPSNASDPEEKRRPEHKLFDEDLQVILSEVVKRDYPYLGICFGLGSLVMNQGGVVSKEKHSEPVVGVDISLTEEGKNDPLLKGLPEVFRAIVGHKEACQSLPENAVLLATGEDCPTQMIRMGENMYATQFHPEGDADGICLRIDIYKDAGYFPPEDAEPLKEGIRNDCVTVPMEILRRFVERYQAN